MHGGIEFIPWHRRCAITSGSPCAKSTRSCRSHYWDWTTDPRVAPPGGAALFTNVFMDDANAQVSHLLQNFESTEGGSRPKVWRNVGATAANGDGTPNLQNDANMLNGANDFATIATRLTSAHDITAHSYIGGA